MKKIIKMICILLTLMLIVGCGCTKKTENVKENINDGIKVEKEVEGFKFKNIGFIYKDGTAEIQTEITNQSDETQYLEEVKIHAKDKDGNEIIELTGFIGENIESGTTITVTNFYNQDLSDTVSIEYELVKQR